MTFAVDVNWPGHHERGLLSDEHSASSYGIPVLVWRGEPHGIRDLPRDVELVVHWRKARTGPVWRFIQRAINAGYPIRIEE